MLIGLGDLLERLVQPSIARDDPGEIVTGCEVGIEESCKGWPRRVANFETSDRRPWGCNGFRCTQRPTSRGSMEKERDLVVVVRSVGCQPRIR